MKHLGLTIITSCSILFSFDANAQLTEQQLIQQDKQMMFLTCINRKPIKPINASAAQECARICKPNGHPSTLQECMNAYKAATGLDYVRNFRQPPQKIGNNPTPGSIRGTGNYPGR